jgi:MerR family copper efflux transcriptional regulator
MNGLTVSQAAGRTGWSARMLRYLEQAGLVVPERTSSGYRLYGVRELNQLRSLLDLRRRFGVELDALAFELRLRREPALRAAVETWLAGTDAVARGTATPAWVEWEQRKHERLLAA